jgi:hypothetical protein
LKTGQTATVKKYQPPACVSFSLDFLYFAVKGAWRQAIVGLVLVLITFEVSWLIYPFFAREILRNHYLRNGWVEAQDYDARAAPLPPRTAPQLSVKRNRIAMDQSAAGWSTPEVRVDVLMATPEGDPIDSSVGLTLGFRGGA